MADSLDQTIYQVRDNAISLACRYMPAGTSLDRIIAFARQIEAYLTEGLVPDPDFAEVGEAVTGGEIPTVPYVEATLVMSADRKHWAILGGSTVSDDFIGDPKRPLSKADRMIKVLGQINMWESRVDDTIVPLWLALSDVQPPPR